jgi:eukaryotic-like serine/threonine-protein kinase
MSLAAGARVGPYEIQAALGAGGMGEVYRARDTRLERTVAIKILPDSLATDPQLRERFDREARAVAALNHPHICTLHDIGEQAADAPAQLPLNYLVMELLAGETLAERLSRGPVPVAQAIEIGAQVASALDAAHRAGLVHRDIKPANIFLVRRGGASATPVAKLLDFGLAKTGSAVGPAGSVSMLPTTPAGVTMQGTILGTLHYMAPEQVEGRDADVRTDIFALGIVLHEMVTGARVFDGRSAAGVMAAILERDAPDLRAVEPATPPLLAHVVARCLAKDPDERWQSAADLMRELRWLGTADAQPGVAAPAHGATARTPWVPALSGLAAGLLVAAAAWAVMRPEQTTPGRVTRLSISPPDGAMFSQDYVGLTASPDGRTVLYSGSDAQGARRLYVQHLDALGPVVVRGTEGVALGTLSPDATQVAFVADGQLKKVALGGGPTAKICDAPPDGVFGLQWHPTGILFGTSAGIMRVPESGGTPVVVLKVDPGKKETGYRHPHLLPDGRTLLYTAWTGSLTNAVVAAASLDSAERRTLFQGASPHLTPTGHVVATRDASLWAAPFDAATLSIRGEPVPVLEGVQIALSGESGFVITADGTLMYLIRPEQNLRLSWFGKDGTVDPVVSEVFSGVLHPAPELSPDGKQLVITVHPPGGRDSIRVYDLERGTQRPLDPRERGDIRFPVWAPNGREITYASTSSGSWDVYSMPVAGGQARELLTRPGDQRPTSWSPDGRVLAFTDGTLGDTDIWTWTPGAEPAPLVATPGVNESEAVFAPDGKHLAFTSAESGRPEVYVLPFPGPGDRIRVSENAGREPRWSRDGRELYFRQDDATLMVASVAQAGSSLVFGKPRQVLQLSLGLEPGTNYVVAPDGRRFLGIHNLNVRQRNMVVVQHWTTELARILSNR